MTKPIKIIPSVTINEVPSLVVNYKTTFVNKVERSGPLVKRELKFPLLITSKCDNKLKIIAILNFFHFNHIRNDFKNNVIFSFFEKILMKMENGQTP